MESERDWRTLEAALPVHSRYDGGMNNPRVRDVCFYFAGMIRNDRRTIRIFDKIAHLYDYKGILVVGFYKPLTSIEEKHLRDAWHEGGNESHNEESCELVSVHSDRWKSLWSSRRFESEWTPAQLAGAE